MPTQPEASTSRPMPGSSSTGRSGPAWGCLREQRPLRFAFVPCLRPPFEGILREEMKRLYLLRHAKSSWDDPTLADHDRPLAPRGRRAAKVMAKHLHRNGIAPELVLCSGSRRTRQTLKRIAPGLGDSAEVQIRSEL